MSELRLDCTPVPLGSLLTRIDTGHSPDLEDSPARPGEWGVLKVSAVREDGFHPEENKVVRDRKLFNPAICVHEGDLLITRANTTQLVGRSCIAKNVPPGLMLCDKTLRLRVDERVIPTKYVHMVLGLPEVRRQIEIAATGTSGSMKNISQHSIRQLMIPIGRPQAVGYFVEVLDSIDSLIGSGMELVAKFKRQHSGVERELLNQIDTPARPLTSFLSMRPRNGFSPNEVETWTGTVALGLGCLTPDGFAPRQLKNVSSHDPHYAGAWVSDRDLLISRSNTFELVGLVGRYRDVGAPCIYPDLMMKLTPNALVRSEFLEIVLRNVDVRERIKRMSQDTSGSMVKISAGALMKLMVKVPDLQTQDRLLSIYTAETAVRVAEEQKIAKFRKLKRGLMDDLLSGRVRVPHHIT